jgi:NTE family protein
VADERVGLVLAGGSARGAYEAGVLSVLLPALESQGQRPTVLLGTSIGAVHAAFLAARAHLPANEVTASAVAWWNQVEPLAPRRIGRKAFRYARGLYGFGRARVYKLLDPAPFARRLEGELGLPIPPEALAALDGVGIVATSVSTSRSVVFLEGADQLPPPDDDRGIEYVPTRLSPAHVLASAAVPATFPAVPLGDAMPWSPTGDWYFDGGTRLNAPIKPAIELGVDRLVIVALNSAPKTPNISRPSSDRPDIADAFVQLIQAGLVDQLVQDFNRLKKRNQNGGQPKVIPYICIAPDPYEIGEIATAVYDEHYARKHFDPLATLGRMTGTERTAVHGEVLSQMFFSKEFSRRLIARGADHASAWLDKRKGQPDYPWDR